MKLKPLISILIAVAAIVSIAYAEFHFTHSVLNGQTKSEEGYWMEEERQYFVYVHGIGTQGVLELRVKYMEGNNVWIDSEVLYNETVYFTVPEIGYYTCVTKNVSTIQNQYLHADWQDTN